MNRAPVERGGGRGREGGGRSCCMDKFRSGSKFRNLVQLMTAFRGMTKRDQDQEATNSVFDRGSAGSGKVELGVTWRRKLAEGRRKGSGRRWK